MSNNPHDESHHPTIAGPTNPIEGLATIGDAIGPYQLRECIGRGGMGEVWRAEQSQPVRRTVALKLIKAGMDSDEVLARFEAERQALALMSHPCIAKIFDAGMTPQGRPYFAMEYIQGTPIHEYCDKRRLDTQARLALFQLVCQGVQHAHQKAVLHRDLKPTNVLVADVDGKPSPKIIDFGVAKATSQKLTEKTMFTSRGQLIGTPEYMSPEQAELTGEDVDTRTDVYSLGVILYELLVGALPFDPRELRKAGYEGIRKVIREQDPQRPSTRLSTLGDDTKSIAEKRATEPKRLSGQLKGDLDWIVMRTLEKDRNRRYGSPQELAQDIQHHLDHEPVLAGPPTASYRAAKFVRRHRAGVTIASASLLALATFATVAAVQANTIARERDRAEAAAAKAAAMNEFLANTLASADPWSGGSRDATIVAALDAASGQLETTFHAQPELEASMRAVLGETYLGLGKLEQAGQQIERAVQMRRDSHSADGYEMAQLRLIEAKFHQNSAEHEKAVESATDAARILARDPETKPGDLLLAHQHQTRNLLSIQRFAAAESTLRICEKLTEDPAAARLLISAENLSLRADLLAGRDGNAAAADSLSRLAYERAKSIDSENPLMGTYLNNAAQYGSQSGDFAGALASFDAALAIYEERFGTDHPEYATCLENRGGVLFQLQRVDECFASLEKVRDIRLRNLGADHIDVVRTGINMGTVAMIAGNNEKALATFLELKPILIASRGNDHPDVLAVLRNEGIALKNLKRYGESLRVCKQALEMAQRLHGEENFATARCRADYGYVLEKLNRSGEALPYMEAAYTVFSGQLGAEHPLTHNAATWLAAYYDKLGQPDQAAGYRVLDKQ